MRKEATQARREAERARNAAEEELEDARSPTQDAAAPDTADEEILEIAERAAVANRELENAIAAETKAASAAQENEDELDRTYDSVNEINMLLQKDLEEWTSEQDEFQESTLQRAVLSRQKEIVERIKERAKAAQNNAEQRDKSLLDEIESQLRG